jgi:hypothetical protein
MYKIIEKWFMWGIVVAVAILLVVSSYNAVEEAFSKHSVTPTENIQVGEVYETLQGTPLKVIDKHADTITVVTDTNDTLLIKVLQ